jgi:hypothetical protein
MIRHQLKHGRYIMSKAVSWFHSRAEPVPIRKASTSRSLDFHVVVRKLQGVVSEFLISPSLIDSILKLHKIFRPINSNFPLWSLSMFCNSDNLFAVDCVYKMRLHRHPVQAGRSP